MSKVLFDKASHQSSVLVTKLYSTSFSIAVKLLDPKIRQDIYNIYGFVRFADEIVDSFHDFDKKMLLDKFEADMHLALKNKISLNPILNAFQETVHRYNIDKQSIAAFMKSMRQDLSQKTYESRTDYEAYIYGSADAVGLMCLTVFVNGNKELYNELKPSAMRLGSAFQKVNFLRDIKQDVEQLGRTYFPSLNLNNLDNEVKKEIILEIEKDFLEAKKGIKKLPLRARFGVYVAYTYYMSLLKKLKNVPSEHIMTTRVRISNPLKMLLVCRAYFRFKLNLL
ncbi:MAG: phytoene/squalene synthase family protein [Flavobacteriales bacterium]